MNQIIYIEWTPESLLRLNGVLYKIWLRLQAKSKQHMHIIYQVSLLHIIRWMTVWWLVWHCFTLISTVNGWGVLSSDVILLVTFFKGPFLLRSKLCFLGCWHCHCMIKLVGDKTFSMEYCEHCDKNLSKSTFYRHKKKWYSITKGWTRKDDIKSQGLYFCLLSRNFYCLK